MRGLLGDVGPLAFQVFRRNLDVYLVTWKTACVSLVEPVFNFLAFGTTAAVARRFGARDPRAAAEHGIAGIWLALVLGTALTAGLLLLAGPIVDVMGASEGVRPHALTYLRIGCLGAPAMLVASSAGVLPHVRCVGYVNADTPT